jgi:hopanoid biosynthesis associated protein HpnK
VQELGDDPAPAARGARIHALSAGAGVGSLKRLIITGDDFGAAVAVNEAIERACRDGILNSASLMVGAPAAADAVARAHRLPSLRVGLHVVLVRGRPVLPPERIPALVGPEGVFPDRLAGAGCRYFFSRAARRQLAAEIRAQFELFRATGLALDHANAHNHLQLHPTVLRLIVAIGQEYGLRAVRVPREPFAPSWRAARTGLVRRLMNDLLLRPLIAMGRRRLARAGIAANDHLFGMNDAGAIDRARLLGIVGNLPDGISELCCHPATGPWPEMEPAARHFRVADELAALTDAAVAAALAERGIERTVFSALSGPGA